MNEVQGGRPCYVRGMLLAEVVADRGSWRRVVKLGGTVTSVELKNGAWVRNLDQWGSPEAFQAAAAWWTQRGMKAPASPAGLVVQAAPRWYQPVAWSVSGPLEAGLRGGWQEARVRGVLPGPHVVYDLRRAYRWALGSGFFPARERLQLALGWDPRFPGLHLVNIDPWPGAPWPLRDGGTVLVETPRDVRRWGPPTVRQWLGGVRWGRMLPASELTDLVDSIGVAACARTFWGPWIARTPFTTEWASGKVAQMPPRTTNASWAHLITARVRERMAGIPASYRYVDAVIVPSGQVVPTGDQVGDWRKVKEYPNGVRVDYPGAYGPADGPLDKHAGTKEVAA